MNPFLRAIPKKARFTLLLAGVFLATSSCGDKDDPKPPQNQPPSGQRCTEVAKVCAGNATPTVDPGTCKQTCPGE